MHFLRYADADEVHKCEWNPANLGCPTYKGFRNCGICAHVVAINHILDKIDLEDQPKELSAPHKKGGFVKGVKPALVKEKGVRALGKEAQECGKRAHDSEHRAPPWKR